MNIVIIFCIFSAFSLRGFNFFVLEDITVPSFLLMNDEDSIDSIQFDCQYEFLNEKSYLVVKWLKDDDVMYQWIRGREPSVIPKYKGKVDGAFSMHSDPNKRYRAMSLLKPNINSTGVYKCSVEAANETQTLEKRMQVIFLKNYTLDITHYRMENITYLECVVSNVYPEPMLRITADDNDEISVVSRLVYEEDDGNFNSTLVATIVDDDDDEDRFTCTVTFMELDLNLTKVITSGDASRTLAHTLLLLILLRLIFPASC